MKFEIARGSLPIPSSSVEKAVESFIKEIDVKGEKLGFYNQTINAMYAAVYRGNGDLWLGYDENGCLLAYVMGHVTTDIDNRLTYWLGQAWVSPTIRGNSTVKEWWQKIRAQAKEYMCKHIVIVSARNNEAYCRWLGKGWHEYATLLKEDI